jgi:uncharacterized delta-60 repeat protein
MHAFISAPGWRSIPRFQSFLRCVCAVGLGGVAAWLPASAASVIGFSSNAAVPVDEAGGTVVLQLQRSGDVSGGATVRYATLDGTATGGSDYTAAEGEIVFAPGATAASVSVAVLNDGLVETVETFSVQLSQPSAGTELGAVAVAQVRIQSNDLGFRFGTGIASVVENTPHVLMVVYRGDDLGTPVSVGYASEDVTARWGSDYTAVSGVLHFTATQNEASILLPLINDGVPEGEERLRLRLKGPSSGTSLGSPSLATYTIVDNDLGLRFGGGPVRVAENGGDVVLRVLRDDESLEPATVDYETSDRGATAGQDYTAVSGRLVFEANQRSATIRVPILNDLVREGDESLAVTLLNPSNGAGLGSPRVAVVAISDNDTGIEFLFNTYDIAEGTNLTQNLAQIVVMRSDESNVPATVEYLTLENSAKAGLDYTPASGTLTFAAGETNKVFTVRILNDGLYEGTESLQLVLRNAAGGLGLGPRSTAWLNIINNDPGFHFETGAQYFVNEAEDFALVSVRRGDDLGGSASVDFSTEGITATPLQDFVPQSGRLEFGPGATEVAIRIPMVNDLLREGQEQFRVLLSNPSAGTSLGQRSTANVRIDDNDIGIEFSTSAYEVHENSDQALITVLRRYDALGSASVTYLARAATATAGADFTEVTGVLNFGSDETSKTFVVPIKNDGVIESREFLELRLSDPGGTGFLGGRVNATLTILDNDGPTGFPGSPEQPGFPVVWDEAAGSVMVPVLRGDDAAETVTVDYTTSARTALPGSDYLERTGQLTFAPGETQQAIEIRLLNDGAVEGVEAFELRLTAVRGGGGLGSFSRVTLSIQDNDAPHYLTIDPPLHEKSGAPNIVLNRGDDGGGPLTVAYAISGGTATLGVDFILLAGSVRFDGGVRALPIPITVLDDPVAEGVETVALDLRDAATGSTNRVSFAILDDERLLVVDGRFRPELPADGGYLQAVARQPNGDLLLSMTGSGSRVIRLRSDGTADQGFRVEVSDGAVLALAAASNGGVVVAGTFTQVLGTPRPALARLTATGQLDPTFDPGLRITQGDHAGTVSAVALQSDGKLLIAGDFSHVNGVLRTRLARLLPDGTLDAAFVPPAVPGAAVVLLPLDGGSVLVGGHFPSGQGVARHGLFKLRDDGSLDESFDAALSTESEVRAVDRLPDGKLLIAGHFATVGGVLRLGLARLEADGRVDATFNAVIGSDGALGAVLGVSGERVLLGGGHFNLPAGSGQWIARFFANGALDPAFTPYPNGLVRWILRDSENTVYIAGDFTRVADVPRPGLARLFLDSADLVGAGFGAPSVEVAENASSASLTLTRYGNTSQSLTVAYATSPGTATSGADYLAVNGQVTFNPLEVAKQIVVPILDDGLVEGEETLRVALSAPSAQTLIADHASAAVKIVDNEVPVIVDRGFAPALEPEFTGNSVTAAVSADGRVYVSAYQIGSQGAATWLLRRLNPDGSIDPAFAPLATEGQVRSLVFDGLGRLVFSGWFDTVSGVPRPGLARLTVDGTLDAEFDPAADSGYYGGALIVGFEPDGDLLVRFECGEIQRVRPDGRRDSSFVMDMSPVQNCIQAAVLLPDGKIVVGLNLGDVAGQALFRFNADGSWDRSFASPWFPLPLGNCCPSINALAVQRDGKLLAGGFFTAVGGKPRYGLVRLHADGTVDDGFVTDPGFRWDNGDGSFGIGTVSRLLLLDDGRLVVEGQWNQVQGRAWPRIARLRADGTLDDTFGPLDLGGGRWWWGASEIASLALQPDGALILGGSFWSVNGIPRPGLARVFGSNRGSSIEFADAVVSVSEQSAEALVTVRRIGDVTQPATLRVATEAGTATEAADYVGQNALLQFAPLENVRTFRVRLLDDGLDEPDESVALTLEDVQGGAFLGLPRAALRVVDNERPGSLDAAFRFAPNPPLNEGPGSVQRWGLAVTDDGGVVLGGWFNLAPGGDYRALIKLLADGSLDPRFQYTDPALGGPVAAAADGAVYARRGDALVRVRADGGLDPTFQASPIAGSVQTLLVQPDGKVLMAIQSCDFQCRGRLQRLLPDGSLDGSFLGASLTAFFLNAMALGPEGEIVLAGNYDGSGTPTPGVRRLDRFGQVDPLFRPELPSWANFNAVFVQPDGKIVLGGYPTVQVNTNEVSGILRLNRDGSLDETFVGGSGGRDIWGNPTEIRAIEGQPDGKLLVAGLFTRFHGQSHRGIARLHADGRLDSTFSAGEGFDFAGAFGPNTPQVEAMVLLPDGQVLVGGSFNRVNGVERMLVARLNGDGVPEFIGARATEAGAFHLTLFTRPLRTYVLEASADLSTWTPVWTNTAASGVIEWTDPEAVGAVQRFYRVSR